MSETSHTATRPPPGTVLDAGSILDVAFYTAQDPGIVAAGLDPADHFERFGRWDGRRPCAWFDPLWYAVTFLGADDLAPDARTQRIGEAVAHFAAEGNAAGLPPSPEAMAEREIMARPLFDERYYRQKNTELGAGLDLFHHFITEGGFCGRRPASWFDPDAWRRRNMAPAAEALNPFLHYVIFHDRDRPIGPVPAAPVAGADTAVFVAEEARTGIEALIAHLAAEGSAPTHEDDVALVAGSALFDAKRYAVTIGAPAPRSEHDTRALVAHLLAHGEEAEHDPSPGFSCAFYRANANALPARAAHLACPPGMHPLVHYLRVGAAAGLYAEPLTAFHDAEKVRASGLFDGPGYEASIGRPLVAADPVVDYVLYGQLEGLRVTPVDDGFVRGLYGPLTGRMLGAPLAFYLSHKHRVWMDKNADDLLGRAALVATSPLFDEAHYRRRTALPDAVNAAAHFLTVGLSKGFAPGPTFDATAYLYAHPDLTAGPTEPIAHYMAYGRNEGRLAPVITEPLEGARTADPSRPLCLIFSHEASRTGAPIVALNVARGFAERYDVIVWLGDADGPLLPDFQETAIAVREGFSEPSAMVREIKALVAGRGDALALVNSVVCNPAVPPLRAAGLPIVSIIHEFADYVSPKGATSRMAVHSDRVVFPARIVSDACEREMAAAGLAGRMDHVRCRPQGANVVKIETEAADAGSVRQSLALPAVRASGARNRILLGVGQVQPRKGVDLFLQAAATLAQRGTFDWRFVWIGGGYNPDRDFITSVYIGHQLRMSGLESRTRILPPRPDLRPYWRAADVFFLSSRLDPFPNVVLDAWMAHRPVVSFEGASGVTEVAAAGPFALHAVPYADTDAAASAIEAFAGRLEETAAAFAGPPGEALLKTLGFDTYVADIEAVAADAVVAHRSHAVHRAKVAHLSKADRARAVRMVPPAARLSSGVVLSDDLEIEVAAFAAARERLDPGAARVRANLGNVAGRPLPAGHRVHIHLLDGNVLDPEVGGDDALQTLDCATRLLNAARPLVSAPTKTLAKDLCARLGLSEATVIAPVDDPLAAVLSALDGPVDRLTFVPLGLTVGEAGAAALPGEVVDACVAALSGAADAELDDPFAPAAAVVPPQRLDETGAAVRAFLGERVFRGTLAPRLAGTWEAAPLRIALKRAAARYRQLGLTPVDRLVVAAHAVARAFQEEGALVKVGLPVAD